MMNWKGLERNRSYPSTQYPDICPQDLTKTTKTLSGKLRDETGTKNAIYRILLYRGEKLENCYTMKPIPVAARNKVWVCGHSLAGIVGSNPTGGMAVCLL